MSWHPVDHDLGTIGVMIGPLDISAAVGSRACLALIRVTFGSGDPTGTAIRINGVLGATAAGPMASQRGSGRDSILFLGITDSSGTLQGVSTTWSTEWTVLGWADVDTPGATVFGPATFPSTWTDITPGSNGVGVFNWSVAAGTAVTTSQMRADTETNDSGYGVNRGDFTGSGNNFAVSPIESSKASIIDTGGETGSITLEALIKEAVLTFTGAVVYDATPAPSTWTEVDCSAYTGPVRGLVLLRVEAKSFSRFAVRQHGDAGEYGGGSFFPGGGTATGFGGVGEFSYLLCETDDTGKVEIRNGGEKLQVIVLAFVPEASSPTWAGEPTGTAIDPDVIGGVAKDALGFDVSTLSLTATPAGGEASTAISGGVVQAGWSGHVLELSDAGFGPREVVVRLTSWPEMSGRLVRFSVDMDSESGASL